MSSLGQQRDRVGEVTAGRLDQREAAENQQRDAKPTLADIVRRAMRAVTMPATVSATVRVPVIMIRLRVVARVTMIVVRLLRVRHKLGKPALGVYT